MIQTESPAARQPVPEFDVPEGESAAATCRHCGRPFRGERALALHLGENHAEALDATESAAYGKATELERDELFYYHAKVVGALGALYSITVVLYMIAFGSGLI